MFGNVRSVMPITIHILINVFAVPNLKRETKEKSCTTQINHCLQNCNAAQKKVLNCQVQMLKKQNKRPKNHLETILKFQIHSKTY
uniref:Putative secreted protein n=1 Tax=Xenopsylla cheopis TaxID=163159 RepID=A0A6M2E1A6_XENCH